MTPREQIKNIFDYAYDQYGINPGDNSDKMTNQVIQVIRKMIDAEIANNLREYVVGDLRPQLIESYYEGYLDALRKFGKEVTK